MSALAEIRDDLLKLAIKVEWLRQMFYALFGEATLARARRVSW